MKTTPVTSEEPSNIFTKHGAIIGWVHECDDGSGFYSQYGTRKKQSFLGAKHATREQAVESIRKINRNIARHTEVI